MYLITQKDINLLLPLLLMMILLSSATKANELEIYQRLKDNGIITEQEFEKLLKSLKSKKEAKQSETNVKVSNKGKLKIKSTSEDFQYQIGGRIQVDAASYDADNYEFTSGTEIRRARLFVKGRMYKNWLWKSQLEFSGNEIEVKDMYLAYEFDPMTLRLGQFSESGSLEDSTSSKNITFMERSLPVLAFAPGERRIGVALNSYHKQGSYSLGFFGDNDSAEEIAHGKGVSGRASYAPWHSKTQTLHLGTWLQYRTPPKNITRFRARPEAHIDNSRLVSTKKIAHTSHYFINGLEAAWVNGAVSLQGEYLITQVSRENDLSELSFSGYYGYASWFITGESRPYELQEGAFGKIKPNRIVTNGGIGAWEVALRFSSINLNDHDIAGGKEDNITLGLNWYANTNIRFMLNYVWVNTDANVGNIDPNIIQARAQIVF